MARDSDQENRDPSATPANNRKKRTTDMPPPTHLRRSHNTLPTPTSDPSDAPHSGQKRKRNGDQVPVTDDERKEAQYRRFYDPNQNARERQEGKRRMREMGRTIDGASCHFEWVSDSQHSARPPCILGEIPKLTLFLENRDDWLKDKSATGPTDLLLQADSNFYYRVKQTNDAVQDGANIRHLSAIMDKKAGQMVLADGSTSIDIDEFVGKCITFMRSDEPPTNPPTQTQRRRTRHPDDDDDDDPSSDQPLNWSAFGHHACLPFTRRPAVPNFLLGPLSVEKKHRTLTQRRPRQAHDPNTREARPEAVSNDSLQNSSSSESAALTTICTGIKNLLSRHLTRATHLLEQQGFTEDDVGTARYAAACASLRLATDGGVRLFDWVINPRSFGQTVENLFYTSFLIKEGAVGISFADEGRTPSLLPTRPSSLAEQRVKGTEKHQAVLALDYAVWRQLIDLYEIREPLIPHRREEGDAPNEGSDDDD
ncbi:hypothetical protein D0869_00073 [Hortaea werneckii]|uniref:Non-structural maintenance of chromosomes element 4 n=1 Tax=Hortaea werneckii TaxID=91943 RepID=A0A3M6XIB6_HORWE|nr:hypothetical protein D0869_00073 [Hortaea werneckii]RMY21536.1 hypothetical protein D0867_03283 [Hortaea werneckii]